MSKTNTCRADRKRACLVPRVCGMRPSIGIALIYLIGAALWIYFSDRVAALLCQTQEQLEFVSTTKGWFFVGVTAALLFFVLKRQTCQMEDVLQQLRTSRKHFEVLLSNLPGIAYRCYDDADWTMEFISQGCEELTGYSDDELTGNKRISFNEIIHPDDRERVRQTVDKKLNNRTAYELEYRIITKDQTIRWVWEKGTGQFNDAGEVEMLEGFITDITARQEAEEKLREQEEQYRLLVENQTDLIVKVDLEGRFLFASPSYLELFEKTSNELLGKQFIPLVHEDDRESTEKAFLSVLAPPYTAYIEQRALTRHGWRWLAWSDTAVRDSEGKAQAVVGIGRDITDKKEIEIALQNRNHELERFNQAATGRELRMIELKQEVNELCKEAGKPEPYPLSHVKDLTGAEPHE